MIFPLPGTWKDLLPVLALLAAVLFWGGSFVAMRVSVKILHPQAVMLCRMVIACLVMLPFAGRLKPDNYQKGDWKLLLPMALLQPCLYFLLESNALKLTTSSQAGVISASVPLLVGIGAWLFLSESISRKVIVGLMISVAGVVLLTLLGKGGGTGDNPFWGNILEFLAMTCAAGSMVIVKRLSSRYNPWTLSGMQFFAGVLFFSPGIVHLMASSPVIFQGNLLLSLGFLGLFASFGAFGLYNWAMSQIPAAKASAFINLVPVVAVISGWTLLGETLSLGQTAAAGMVAAGVIISQRTGKVKVRSSLTRSNSFLS